MIGRTDVVGSLGGVGRVYRKIVDITVVTVVVLGRYWE